MGIDLLFVRNSLYRLEEIFNAGIFQNESFDTCADEFQDFFFHVFGTMLAYDYGFTARHRG